MIVLLNANSLHIPLKDKSIHCVVTSIPYYGLRDYGLPPNVWGGDPDCEHDWNEYIQPCANGIIADDGMSGETLSGNSATRKPKKSNFCSKCGAWLGCYGLEPSPELFVEHTVMIFQEVWRVLRDNGTLWLNIGDSYAGSGGAGGDYNEGGLREGQPRYKSNFKVDRSKRNAKKWSDPMKFHGDGIKQKDLIGIPWMVAFALRADGWYLRMDNIWNKPNPMPESVSDRPSKAHEYIFLLTKKAKYYYDQEAILEPVTGGTHARISQDVAAQVGSLRATVGAKTNGPMKAVIRAPKMAASGSGIKNNESMNNALALPVLNRNKRSVWTVTTKPYSGAHFAVYPPELVEPCILAGTSEKGCCPQCGAPWERVVEKKVVARDQLPEDDPNYRPNRYTETKQAELRGEFESGVFSSSKTIGWRPTCDHGLDPIPCTVLDPFSGSGTTVMVARQLGRSGIGLDLSLKYILECAKERLGMDALQEWMEGKKVEATDLTDLPMFAGMNA